MQPKISDREKKVNKITSVSLRRHVTLINTPSQTDWGENERKQKLPNIRGGEGAISMDSIQI